VLGLEKTGGRSGMYLGLCREIHEYSIYDFESCILCLVSSTLLTSLLSVVSRSSQCLLFIKSKAVQPCSLTHMNISAQEEPLRAHALTPKKHLVVRGISLGYPVCAKVAVL
jgi:hypothetical protein